MVYNAVYNLMKKQTKAAAALLLLISIAVLLWASKRPNPLRKFDAIRLGMHSNEVVTTVGVPTQNRGPERHSGQPVSGDLWSYSYGMGFFSYTLWFTTNGHVSGTMYQSPFERHGDLQ